MHWVSCESLKVMCHIIYRLNLLYIHFWGEVWTHLPARDPVLLHSCNFSTFPLLLLSLLCVLSDNGLICTTWMKFSFSRWFCFSLRCLKECFWNAYGWINMDWDCVSCRFWSVTLTDLYSIINPSVWAGWKICKCNCLVRVLFLHVCDCTDCWRFGLFVHRWIFSFYVQWICL